MKDEIRILLLEDKPADAEWIENVLREAGLHFRLQRVEAREEFEASLRHAPPDLILSDHGLPSFDGRAALELQQRLHPEIPFIFVTGARGGEPGYADLRGKATDVVIKERVPALLGAAVKKALEQRQRQERRRGAERLLGILDRVADGFMAVDRDGRVTYMNDRAAQWLGVEREQLLDRLIWEHFPRQILHFHQNYYRAVVSQQTVQAEEFIADTGRWFEYRFFPSGDGVSIVLQDITERKLAEEALRRSEARKRTLLEIALDAIITIDHLGIVQEWNPAAEKLFGYPAEQALGREMAELIIPEYLRGLHRQGLAHYLETGEGQMIGKRLELTAVRSDGTEFPVEITINRIPHTGLPVYTGFLRDITQRKKAEAELTARLKQQAGVAELGRRVLSADDLHAFLRSAAQLVTEILDTDFCSVFQYDATEQHLRLVSGARLPQHLVGTLTLPLDAKFPSALALSSQEPVVVRRLAEDPRFEVPPLFQEYGVVSALAVVIGGRDRPFGVLTTLTKQERQFAPNDIHFLQSVSNVLADACDRLQKEAELRRSEERFRMLVMGVRDYMICMLDPEGRIVTWNEGAEGVTGYASRDILEGPLGALFPEEDQERMPRMVLETAAREGHFEREVRLARKEGSLIWGHMVVDVLRDDRQRLYGFTVIVQDITQRRRTEEALRESEARFRTMADTAPVMIWMAEPSGSCTYFNKPWLDFTGRTFEEEQGDGWLQHVHPADRDRCIDRYLSAFQIQQTFKMEYRLKHRDGQYRWVLDTGVPRYTPDGSFAGYIGSCIDITDRKQAEDALRKSEERFRTLVENAEDYAIYMLDPKGRVSTWNSGAERILGYKAEEVTGKHFSRFFPTEDVRSGKPDRSLRIASQEGKYREEGWRVRKDGSRFWATVTLTALKDETGRIYGYSKILRDITERRAAQEVIFRLNAELEQRVAKRTEQLEAANKELEAFSYSVSHDLRAPLRHIDGFVGILENTLRDRLDHRSRRYFEIISESAREMSRLIDDLLEFSRMGRAELRSSEVPMRKLVDDVIQDVREKIPDRRIEWTVGDLPNAQGDPVLLRQVWVNLVSNAVKYTRGRDPARIEIGGSLEANECVFYVRDNGVGFDMQYANKLFGVFQRLHSTREFEGTGIGLANVRRVIQRHGGRTWAEGSPGQGAAFYFSLPVRVEAEA